MQGSGDSDTNESMSEELVSVAEGSMNYIKELVVQCQQSGIEVSMDRCRTKS